MESKLTVVVPALNEERIIGEVIREVQDKCADFLQEIIVVDDGSTDSTARIAGEAGARVISHKRNMGYGAALKTGIRNTRTAFVLTMDSDGQHRSEDVVRLWKACGSADMVVGERTALIHSPLWRMPGKWVLGRMADYLTGCRIRDLNSGLRIMRRDVVLKYLHLCPSGFSFSTTMTMALLSRGYDIAYVPIDVNWRVGRSAVKVITGLETIILILRIAALFGPLRIFVPASAVIGLAGLAWGIPIVVLGRGVSVGSMLAIVTAILLFGLGLLCDQISQLRLERYE